MRRREESTPRRNQNSIPIREINTIVEGLTIRGASIFDKKEYAQRARYEEVFRVERPPKQARTQKTLIVSFGDVDCEGVIYM